MNIFDKTYQQSKTSISEKTEGAPSHHINIARKTSEVNSEDFGSIIVNFYWSLEVETIAAAYTEKQKIIKKVGKSSTNVNTESGIFFTPEKAVEGLYSLPGVNPYDRIGLSLTSSAAAKTLAAELDVTKEFENCLTHYFKLNKLWDDNSVLAKNSLDYKLNKQVNESLLSVRTSISDKIGSGTATITLENVDNQWLFQKESSLFEDLFGQPMFLEGMYFTIDAIGRYDTTKFYRIFKGSITSVNFIDNPTERKITIEAKDLSKLLTYSRFNIHPAFWESEAFTFEEKARINDKLRESTNLEIAEIIIPDISNGTWRNVTDKYSMKAFKEMWKVLKREELPTEEKSTELGTTDIVTRSYSTVYNSYLASYDPTANDPDPVALLWGDTSVDQKNGTYNPKDKLTVYANQLKISNLRVSEFKTRADILNDISTLTLFTSYVDASGNLHFHPPRYDYLDSSLPNPLFSLDYKDNFLENPYIYTFNGDEIINESHSYSEDDIVTNLKVVGENDFGIWAKMQAINPTYKRPNILWTDGCRRFGIRERKVSTAAFESNDTLKIFGVLIFIRLYLERKKISLTVPLRPEIDIDRPIYLPDKKMVYHIKSISHSYSAGSDRGPGDWTTTISGFAGRPLSQANLLQTNIYKFANKGEVVGPEQFSGQLSKTLNIDTILNILKQHGFNLLIDIAPEGGISK